MLTYAIVLFAIAAVGGLTMALMHFRSGSPPRVALAVLHGLFGASGLIVLLLTVFNAGAGRPAQVALGMFVLAAMGGFTLLSFHLRKRVLPDALVVGHGLLAVCAFAVLLAAVFIPGL